MLPSGPPRCLSSGYDKSQSTHTEGMWEGRPVGMRRGLTILVGLLLDLLGDLVVQLGVGGVSFGRRHCNCFVQ